MTNARTMIIHQAIGLGALVMLFTPQPRLTQRPLADIAVVGLPENIKTETYKGYRDDQVGRLTFGFSSTLLLASFGSITTNTEPQGARRAQRAQGVVTKVARENVC